MRRKRSGTGQHGNKELASKLSGYSVPLLVLCVIPKEYLDPVFYLSEMVKGIVAVCKGFLLVSPYEDFKEKYNFHTNKKPQINTFIFYCHFPSVISHE